MRTETNTTLVIFAFALSILVLSLSLSSQVFGKQIFVLSVLALSLSTGALIKTSRSEGGKMVQSKLMGWILLLIGLLSLFLSVYFNSTMLVFVGLGLTFWGAIVSYISPEPHVKSRLLDATILPSLQSLDEMLEGSGFSSKGIYLPPELLEDPGTNKIYVGAGPGGEIPELEIIRKDVDGRESSNSAFISPLGSKLMKTFEDELGKSFLGMEMEDFRWKLPELLIEDLEIAEDVKARNEGNSTSVEIEGSPYSELCNEVGKMEKVGTLMGCPLCSAIACALSKVTGEPIIIDGEEPNLDGETINTRFRVLDGD